ncbi:hypothetical protein ABL78_0660 [Leptomonas seymouri]|uniref:Uncharacterized protein n=1 Tax=Leptomonas seymouri TaxID=5684 RepID=A0A0N1I8J3_LEPSE|nr:hypothetical protein ABL78_0660 [Leptomonas seymouri]|eukprot:KPI90278.1 hypothetical protein ABL78_0660 [Leptomonas seymouri]
MKPKQEGRAPAKHQVQSGRTKPVKAVSAASSAKTPAALSCSQCDFDDVADLFSAIKKTKARQMDASATGASAKKDSKTGTKVTTGRKGGSSAATSSFGSNAEAKPVRDGLYHAPQKSLQMSDNEFFSGTWLKADQATTANGGLSVVGGGTDSTEASQELLRKEGVDRIVSMEELTKMLSRNAKAGTTPNCPFDCDCCF